MSRKGFTLLEILIVIIILGIIAAIAIPTIVEERENAKVETAEAAVEEPAPLVAKTPPIPSTTRSTTTDELTSTIYEVAVLQSVGGERPTLKEIWPNVGSRTGVTLKGWLNGNNNAALVSINGTTYIVNYDQSVGMVVNIEKF